MNSKTLATQSIASVFIHHFLAETLAYIILAIRPPHIITMPKTIITIALIDIIE